MACLKNKDTRAHDVSVVSPGNDFRNTPALPGATAGSVEARSLIDPARRVLPGEPGEDTLYEAARVEVHEKARTSLKLVIS